MMLMSHVYIISYDQANEFAAHVLRGSNAESVKLTEIRRLVIQREVEGAGICIQNVKHLSLLSSHHQLRYTVQKIR